MSYVAGGELASSCVFEGVADGEGATVAEGVDAGVAARRCMSSFSARRESLRSVNISFRNCQEESTYGVSMPAQLHLIGSHFL